MDRKALKRMIQQEIARVREDLLVKPEEVPDDFRIIRGKVCPICKQAPCTCDDYGDLCPACGMNPCQCVSGKQASNPYKLSCAECGSVIVMQEGCGCSGSSNVFEPLGLMPMNVHATSICPDCGMSPCVCDEDHHHRGGAYMAKSQLHKLEEYSRKLQQMIPEGYDLEDWMRSHISQAADDISEVYHKLEYMHHKD